jgi:hypothetical protein
MEWHLIAKQNPAQISPPPQNPAPTLHRRFHARPDRFPSSPTAPTASPRRLRNLHPRPGRSERRPHRGRCVRTRACFRRAMRPSQAELSSSTSVVCTSIPPSTTTRTPSTLGSGRSGWTWPRAAAAAPSPPLAVGRGYAWCLTSLGSRHPSSTHDPAGSRESCAAAKTAPAPFVPSESPSPFGTLAGVCSDPSQELLSSPSVPSQELIDLLPELLPS